MRRARILPLAVVAAGAIIGWTALWLLAAHEAGARADAFINAEAGQGREWTCPNRTVGGYPLAIAVSCSDPTFSGESFGERVQGSVAKLTAEASVLHPRTIAVTLAAPFAYKTSDAQTDIKGTWAALRVELGSLPDVRTMVLVGRDIAIDGRFGQAGDGGGHAASLDARFTASQPRPDPTLAFDIAVSGTPVPALDALLGDSKPVALALTGTLDHAVIGDAQTPEDMMDSWRRAGGRIDLGASQVTRAGAKVAATGTLGLDASHRLRGRLDADFFGLEPILARYGISGNLAAAGSILSSLFGGGGKRAEPPAPGALSLPISFTNGRLGVGPIRTDVTLTPLY